MVVLAGTRPKWWDQVSKKEVMWPKGFLPNSKFAHFVKSKRTLSQTGQGLENPPAH